MVSIVCGAAAKKRTSSLIAQNSIGDQRIEAQTSVRSQGSSHPRSLSINFVNLAVAAAWIARTKVLSLLNIQRCIHHLI